MSWSFTAAGKGAQVAAAARAEKGRNACKEPEESFRQTALELLAQSAEANLPGVALKAEAAGSMWLGTDGVHQNNLTLMISPIYGWIDPPAPPAPADNAGAAAAA